MANKNKDILLKYFNPDSYKRYLDGDFYLISHNEYIMLKKDLDAVVSGDEQWEILKKEN